MLGSGVQRVGGDVGKLAIGEQTRPLVVDLDGTLVRSDLLIETAFAELGRRPLAVFGLIGALFRGKAALKHRLSESAAFDPASLPYDPVVLAQIRACREAGRPVYLASASAQRLVAAVADHLGLFDGWFASTVDVNLSGEAKAARLVDAFGEAGFDYIGNDAVDLAVWRRAHEAISIRAPRDVERRLADRDGPVTRLEAERPTWRTWIKLLRVHQYAKNSLLFVPLLTAHAFDLMSIVQVVIGVIAFSLCASSVYILNDLVDVAADRAHPTKRNRPLANGSIPPIQALFAVFALLTAGFLAASTVSLPFVAVLTGYLALTTAYSFYLKRKLMIDVVVLAVLYATRVIAGATALDTETSNWLLVFSLFIFTSLALMKRYIELTTRVDAGLSDPSNRNYKLADLNVVMAIAAAAGMNAVTILALYVNSPEVEGYYRYRERLWLLLPLLVYWLGRALVLAHRRVIEDDPIIFAIQDNISRYTVAAMVVVVLFAI